MKEVGFFINPPFYLGLVRGNLIPVVRGNLAIGMYLWGHQVLRRAVLDHKRGVGPPQGLP